MPSEVNSPTVRAAIYARYSSDNQREASIDDQVEVCRRYAQLQGWTIVEIYADRAQSGTSRFRPQFQQLEVDAQGRRFYVILVIPPRARAGAAAARHEQGGCETLGGRATRSRDRDRNRQTAPNCVQM
jgi:predicted site-specific integrase-resolvase